MKGIILLTLLGFAIAAPSGRKPCLCELLVDEVRGLVADHDSQDKILGYVSDMCSNLEGEDKTICRMMIDHYSDLLMDTVTSHLTTQEVCGLLPDVCPGVEEHEPEPISAVLQMPPVERILKEARQPQGPLECELCKFVIMAVDRVVGNNKSAAAINETLEKLCDSLPAALSATCKQIEPEVVDAIEKGVDPNTACKLIKLCTLGKESEPLPCDACLTSMDAVGLKDPESACIEMEICPEKESKPEPVEPEVIEPAEYVEPAETNIENLEDGLECQLCKLLVNAIDKLVGENKTAATVNATLYEFCDALPGELKDICLQEEPEILKAVLGGIDPTKACDFIKACHDTLMVPVNSMYIPCDLCKVTLEKVAGKQGIEVCYEVTVCDPEQEINHDINRSVMSPPEIEIGDDAKCDLCKFVVQLLDQVLEDNATLPKVNATLFDICKAVPAQFQAMCASLIPKAEMLIEQGFDPTKACDAVKFCDQNSEDDAPIKTDLKDEVTLGDGECDVCKIIIEILDEAMENNATVPKINATLFAICKAVPKEYQALCASMIPKAEMILEHGFNPTNACKALHLCDGTMKGFSFPLFTCDDCHTVLEKVVPENTLLMAAPMCVGSCRKRSRRSIPENMERWQSIADTLQQSVTDENNIDASFLGCEVCKIAVRLVDEIAGQNASLATVNQTLEEICTRLTGQQLVDMCLQEAPKILQFMQNGIQPDQVCVAASMCDAEKADEPVPSFKDVLYNKGMKEGDKVDNVEDLKCDLCEELVKFLDAEIGKNATEDKVNATLFKLCNDIPAGQFHDVCLLAIPEIEAALKNGADPDTACKFAKLCDAQEVELVEEEAEAPVDEEQPNDLKCDLCKELLQFVDTQLENNATDEKINETLYRICNGLPSALFKQLCMSEVPEIMKTVNAGGVDPEKGCEAAKLCTAGKSTQKNEMLSEYFELAKKELEIMEQQPGSVACDLCKELIMFVDAQLANNETDEKINQTLNRLCQGLPAGVFQELCMSEIPAIMATVENGGIDPEKGCETARLCDGENGTGKKTEILSKLIRQENQKEKNTGIQADLKCEICEAIIAEADSVLAENGSIARVNSTMMGLCDRLPGALKDVCLQVEPQLIQVIMNGVDPKEGCSKIGLCSTSQKTESVMMEMEKEGKPMLCDACAQTMKVVYDNLENDYAKIQPVLASLCLRLPEQYQYKCGEFLEADKGLYFKTFLEQVNPNSICEAMECQ